MGIMVDYIKYHKKCIGSRTFWELRTIYNNKQKRLQDDKVLDQYHGINRKDLRLTTYECYEKDKVAVYLMYDADQITGRMAYGVKMDFMGFYDEKKIRECTFEEFLDIYAKYL